MLSSIRHVSTAIRVARAFARNDVLEGFGAYEAVPMLRGVMKLFALGGGLGGGDSNSESQPVGARLAKALQELGPLYVKLGQALATRPDILGEQAAKDLMVLQDRMPAFPVTDAIKTIEAELECKLADVFSEFERKPRAAASIAQVHKAITTDGQPVAVKILRPGVERAFARDLSTLTWIAARLEQFVKPARRLRPMEMVAVLAETVSLEMDLRLEAAAAGELADNLRVDDALHVPSIDWSRTGQRVLTIQWIDGVSLADRQTLVDAGHDPSAIAKVVIRSFLHQTMRDGFFHADLHQGNLLVDGKSNVWAVDFGIMGRLDRDSRRYLAEILRGIHTRDYQRVADMHFDAGYVPPHKSRDAFAQALRALGEPIHGTPLGEISFGKLLAQLFRTTEQFDMQAQPQLLLLQKTMVMVEGLTVHLDPGIDMWTVSPPIVRGILEDTFSPTAEARYQAKHLRQRVENLPRTLRRAEQALEALADGRVGLSDDSLKRLAALQARARRPLVWGVWALAALLALYWMTS